MKKKLIIAGAVVVIVAILVIGFSIIFEKKIDFAGEKGNPARDQVSRSSYQDGCIYYIGTDDCLYEYDIEDKSVMKMIDTPERHIIIGVNALSHYLILKTLDKDSLDHIEIWNYTGKKLKDIRIDAMSIFVQDNAVYFTPYEEHGKKRIVFPSLKEEVVYPKDDIDAGLSEDYFYAIKLTNEEKAIYRKALNDLKQEEKMDLNFTPIFLDVLADDTILIQETKTDKVYITKWKEEPQCIDDIKGWRYKLITDQILFLGDKEKLYSKNLKSGELKCLTEESVWEYQIHEERYIVYFFTEGEQNNKANMLDLKTGKIVNLPQKLENK